MPRRCLSHRGDFAWVGSLGAALLALAVAGAAAKDKETEGESVPITIVLSTRDATGKDVPAPNVKLHVTRLGVDPVTQDSAKATFPLMPGSYTLTTVTGRRCQFVFSVESGKPMTIALVVPASGNACLRVDSAASAASKPSPAASHASSPNASASHASAPRGDAAARASSTPG